MPTATKEPSAPPLRWSAGSHRFDLSEKGVIMGILNLTPDSFSDGGKYSDPQIAVEHALQMVEEGAEILDLGAESTKPGAAPVSAEEELRRILPTLKKLREQTTVAISIDTSKARVASACIQEGADIINDITALRGDPEMPAALRASSCGVVLMHMQGTPATMQQAPCYDAVVPEILGFLDERCAFARQNGIATSRLCVDPGIGFGKTFSHNNQIIKELHRFSQTEIPLLIGVSRKSYLGGLTSEPDPSKRLWQGVALTSYARAQGAKIFRVHDVRENFQAMKMTEAILPS